MIRASKNSRARLHRSNPPADESPYSDGGGGSCRQRLGEIRLLSTGELRLVVVPAANAETNVSAHRETSLKSEDLF